MKKLLLIIISIQICICYTHADLIEGLVAFYPFNGNAYDNSSNSLNGAVSGAILTEDRFGNSNSAYYFDGIDDFICMDNIGMFDDFSFSLWAMSEKYQSGDSNILDYGQRRSELIIFNDAQVRINVDDTNGGATKTTEKFQSELGVWHNYTMTKNGNHISFYADGMLTGETDIITHLSTTQNTLYLGGEDGKRYFFNGAIDDVSFYNYALSETDINQIVSVPEVATRQLLFIGLILLFFIVMYDQKITIIKK